MRVASGWLAAAVSLWALIGTSQTRADDPKVYFGYLHSHTSYSDGSGKPADAYARAKAQGLDFLAVTEHNHRKCEQDAAERADGVMIATRHDLYNGRPDAVVQVADALNQDGRFVTIYGQEFSTISSGNHVCVFDIKDVIDETLVPSGEFNKLLDEWLPKHLASNGKPAILQFNHPFSGTTQRGFDQEYGKDDFGSAQQWVKRMDERVRTIEILNGPGTNKVAPHKGVEGVEPTVFEKAFLDHLNLGFHVAPSGDQDNHYENWGTETNARTGVIADGLTRAKILAALDARHVYATQDKNLKIIFRVNGHFCGDILPPPAIGTALTIDYSLDDADEPTASYRVDVFSGTIGGGPARVVETVDVPADPTKRTIRDIRYMGGRQYVFFRVRQFFEDAHDHRDDRAWTAPVWFDIEAAVTPGAPGPSPTTPPKPPSATPSEPEEVANFVASKHSHQYHISLDCVDAQRISPESILKGAQARKGRTLHPGCPRKVQ